jgi:glycosyltransferase involved in cell wall biosynthesis
MVESDLRERRQEIQRLISELARRHLVTRDLATRLTSTETDLEYVTAPFNGRLLSGYRQIRQPSVPSPDGAPVATTATEHPVLPRFPGKYDVVCFPIIDWRFRFQRPQQLCTRFAQDSHRVFYLNTRFHSDGPKATLQKITEGVYDVQMPGPSTLNLYRDDLDENLLFRMIVALDELRTRAGVDDALCVVQLPFWARLALGARTRWGWHIVYDCMDEHSGFLNNTSSMLSHEEELMKSSDLVVATSRSLFDKSSSLAKQTALIPNACDFEHFNTRTKTNPLSHLGHPIVGYYGAIADWFDVGMIGEAAKARPDWQFVLIGHTFGADTSQLERIPNIHLLGEQPYTELPAYLQAFDVACIPFLINPLTKATNPVKFYEYLSAGKPIVAVELPELEPYRDYFYPVRNAADFVAQVEVALKIHTAEKAREGIEFARQNTWGHRYRQLSDSVAEIRNQLITRSD